MTGIGLTDAPLSKLTDESLGLRDHIDALVQFISQCNTPMTISIQGDWGSGKTSMMKLIENQLIAMNIPCVWFNTWQFSQFNMQDDVPVALLMALLKAIGAQDSKWSGILLGFCKRTAEVAAAVAGGKEVSEAMRRALETTPLDMFAQLSALRRDIQKAIDEKLAGQKNKRLVVFVDDLDRMNPGKAVEALEVIKNFLDLDKCVFVIAVDYAVVSAGAKIKYGEDMTDLKGRSFFDKIIQMPFNLPVAQYNISKYLTNILDIPAEETRAYRELAENSIGANPRALKRVANIINLLKLLAAKNYPDYIAKPEFGRLLFAIICLQLAYESVYSAILSRENPLEFIREVLNETPEGRDELFAASLASCPEENKDELKRRFNNFLDAFIRNLPKKTQRDRREDTDKEEDLELFLDILNMSGLTSSGNLTLEKSAAARNSFDPALIAAMPDLCDKITRQYSSLWDILGLRPEFRMRDAIFVFPVAFDWMVSLDFALSADGIYVDCYSEYSAPAVKKPFYDLLHIIAPNIVNNARYSGGARNFLILGEPDWTTPTDDKSVKAVEARQKQIADILEQYARTIFQELETICRDNLDALNREYAFIEIITAKLLEIFPANDGWDLRVADRGVVALPDLPKISIRKNSWRQDLNIILEQDKYGQIFLALRQRKDPDFKTDTVAERIYNRWLELSPMPAEKLTGRNDNNIIWAFLPKPVTKWTSGRFFFPDFKYILDAEKENYAQNMIEDYARRFLAAGKEIARLDVKTINT
ncbi:MAG: KAP family NTPase [Desulfovibrio sp.]|nr:KAP family NTPase [Desulfovibrio sp.]